MADYVIAQNRAPKGSFGTEERDGKVFRRAALTLSHKEAVVGDTIFEGASDCKPRFSSCKPRRLIQENLD